MSILNRQRDQGIPDGVVDINDHILQENMFSTEDALGEAQRGYISGVDVSDEIILEGDPIPVEPPKGRLRPGQIIILSVTAAFAIGGAASFLKPEATKPTAVASMQKDVPPVSPPTEVTLPAGLSFVDKDAPLAAPSPVKAETSATTPVATVPLNPPAPPAGIVTPPQVEASNPSATPVPATATVAAAPQVDIATATVAATPPAVIAKQPPANPIAAQAEEAKQLMASSAPTKQATAPAKPEPVAAPKASQKESVAKTDSQPRAPQRSSSAEKTAPTATSAKKPAQDDQPKTVAKAVVEKPVSTVKSSTPAPARKAASVETKEAKEEGTEMIKTLVSTSAEAFGLQSMQEGAITLDRNRGASSQRFTVGDRLPSGEQILRIDARSMTLVTDRSVIRFN